MLLRALTLGAVALAIGLLLSSMSGGVGAVAWGVLLVVCLVCGTTFVWARADARRHAAPRSVALTWVGVCALLAAGYLAAALLSPGDYGASMPVPEILLQTVVLTLIIVGLPATLGILSGRRTAG